jgi:hypothetical protein
MLEDQERQTLLGYKQASGGKQVLDCSPGSSLPPVIVNGVHSGGTGSTGWKQVWGERKGKELNTAGCQVPTVRGRF